MRRLIARVDPVLIQALIAAALSFAHLHDIATAAGQTGWKGWAYPVSVDLLLVASWRRLRTNRATGGPIRLAWVWFIVALTASLGANVATAGLMDLHAVPAWLRILVAGWPAAAFLGGTLLAHNPTPESTTAPTTVEPTPEPAPSLATVEPTPEPVYLPAPALAPAAAPVLTAAPAPTGPAHSTAPAAAVPAPLLAHARKVADEHAARTGTPIDTATLRNRLGIPPQLAAAITAQLT